ncbi:hypothetical protein GCM10010306_068020 [Streptomyces umbrinus]|nr:hypothetical protein GCM10010306_068020 [Streptomyces umbrinus]
MRFSALFERQAVLGADAREQGDLLAAQTRDPPPGPARQTDVLGAEPLPAGSAGSRPARSRFLLLCDPRSV